MTREVVVGVIGCGYWGPNVIRSFAAVPGCRVKRAADLRPGRLRFVAEQFPALELSGDHEAVLRDPEINAVAVVTPVSTHHALALAAIAHGKHVFVEKPLAATPAEAEAMVAAAAHAGVQVGVGHLFEYHPAVTAMRAAIARGAIGDVAYLDAARINLGPPASEVNVLWDLAPHDISLVLLFAGDEPKSVTAFANSYTRDGMLDAAFVHLAFAGGRMAQIHVSWLSPHKTRRLWVMGTKGSILYDDTAAEKVRIFDQGFDSRVGTRDDDAHALFYRPANIEVPALRDEQPLQVECAAFVHAVRSGTPPPADGAGGVRVVRVLAAAERSLAAGSRAVALREVR
jgi:predicted dehydrogenase